MPTIILLKHFSFKRTILSVKKATRRIPAKRWPRKCTSHFLHFFTKITSCKFNAPQSLTSSPQFTYNDNKTPGHVPPQIWSSINSITQSYIRLMSITLPSSPATIWEVTPPYQNTSTYSGRLPRRSTQPTWNKTITSSLKLTLIRLTQVIKKAIFASHADYELKIVWNFQTHTTLLFSVGITFSKWHKYIFRKMAKRETTNRWVNVTSSFSS